MKVKDSFYTLLGKRRDQTVAFSTIIRKIWSIRKDLIKWEIVGVVVGLILCFSYPKEYNTTIRFVQEKTNPINDVDASSESILSTLMNRKDDPDAFSKNLYALLIDSSTFFYDLLDLKLENRSHSKYSVRELLTDELKHPWWYYISQYPIDLLFNRIERGTGRSGSKYMPNFNDLEIITELQKRIMLSEVERSGMLELEVQMQDPLVAAVLADTVSARLERMLRDYRHEKYLNKFEYTKRRVAETEAIYRQLQDSLASFQDTHNNLTCFIDRSTEERLRRERDIAFYVYRMSRMEQQVAETKLFNNKNIFFTVECSRVAVKASSPRKLVILSYTVFLSAFIPIMRVIWGKSNDKNEDS